MPICSGDFSDPDNILLARYFKNDIAEVNLHVNTLNETRVVVTGKGSVEGSKRMIGFLQETVAVVGEGNTSKVWIDLRDNDGAPMRAQVMFAKWFTKHRRFIGPTVLIGAGPVERRIANFVLKVARLGHVKFFKADQRDAAHDWLYNNSDHSS